jgi:dihydroneopterin aldolase
MKDSISLIGLKAWGYHGVLESERETGQEFIVDVELFLDLHDAGKTDELEATMDYSVIAVEVVDIISGQPFDLIEKLATVIATKCLSHHQVDSVIVKVHKPSAPITVAFDDVIVTVQRSRR